jgi:hypothetical protein
MIQVSFVMPTLAGAIYTLMQESSALFKIRHRIDPLVSPSASSLVRGPLHWWVARLPNVQTLCLLIGHTFSVYNLVCFSDHVESLSQKCGVQVLLRPVLIGFVSQAAESLKYRVW